MESRCSGKRGKDALQHNLGAYMMTGRHVCPIAQNRDSDPYHGSIWLDLDAIKVAVRVGIDISESEAQDGG